MTIEIYLNQIGFPKIAELANRDDLPGIGEKISLEESKLNTKNYEVTEIKKDNKQDTIYIYVNSIN